MNRRPLLALAFALTTAATGCGDGNPPGDVQVYWGFVRNTAEGQKLYDAVDPADATEGPCSESGVEYVRVTTLEGRDIDPAFLSRDVNVPSGAISCVTDGAHGVTFRAIRPATHTWNVTAYRTFNGTAIPVAQSSTTFDVRPDQISQVIVDVQPIQDDVQLTPLPWNTTNTAVTSCLASGISEMDVFLWTFIGDAVVSQTVTGCGPVTVRLDRDDYYVRMQGFASSAATQPTHDSRAGTNRCEDTLITQLGSDGGGTNWSIDLRNVVGATPCS